MESDYSYDVFLSYNSDDQSAAEFLVNKLMAGGVQVFWDRNLAAGDPWLVVLEKALLRSQTVMFLLGPSGFGRGQQREVEQLVIARGSRRAIPVLLPGSKDSDLPLTLRGYIWVDLRKGLDDPDAFNQLVEVIQGKRPLFDRLSPRARKAILRADTFRRSIGGGQAPMGTTASLTVSVYRLEATSPRGILPGGTPRGG